MPIDMTYRSAIKRAKLSAPARWLYGRGLINRTQTVLDYGCGYGGDVKHLFNRSIDIEGYDPHYGPPWQRPHTRFDVVLCTYVLCVIPDRSTRLEVLASIFERLQRPAGVAYITVRRDTARLGYRPDGTWQGRIVMDLPITYECAKFTIYEMTRDDLALRGSRNPYKV